MGFKSILDPEFKYRNAASTDVRKTFERIRKEQRLEQDRRFVANDYGSSKAVARITNRRTPTEAGVRYGSSGARPLPRTIGTHSGGKSCRKRPPWSRTRSMKILSLPIAPVGRSCSTRRVHGCARHCASATSAQPRGSSQSRGIAFHSTQVIFSFVRT